PRHDIVVALAKLGDGERAFKEDAAHLLFDEARVLDGERPTDARQFSDRLPPPPRRGPPPFFLRRCGPALPARAAAADRPGYPPACSRRRVRDPASCRPSAGSKAGCRSGARTA